MGLLGFTLGSVQLGIDLNGLLTERAGDIVKVGPMKISNKKETRWMSSFSSSNRFRAGSIANGGGVCGQGS